MLKLATSSAHRNYTAYTDTHTQAHTHTHIYSSDRQSISKLPRRKRKRRRKPSLSETIVSTSGGKLDDSGLLLSQLLFLLTWKSDVATNPKISLSLSDLLSLPLCISPLALSFLLASLKTHALFIFILLQQHKTAIRLLLPTDTYTQKQSRAPCMHAQPCTCALDHAIPLPECDAALNSLCFYTHCCGYTTQLLDQAEPQTHLLAATQGEWAWADCG